MKLETMYYVVTKRLAEAMMGERIHRNPKGTVYGVFDTPEKAAAFQEERKLALVTRIVAQ